MQQCGVGERLRTLRPRVLAEVLCELPGDDSGDKLQTCMQAHGARALLQGQKQGKQEPQPHSIRTQKRVNSRTDVNKAEKPQRLKQTSERIMRGSFVGWC